MILYMGTLTSMKTFKCTLLDMCGFGGEKGAVFASHWLTAELAGNK